MKIQLYCWIFILLLVLMGCEREDGVPSLPTLNNPTLLFPATKPLDIQQGVSSSSELYFEHSELNASALFIAILSQPPIIANDQLVNTTDIVWQWLDTPRENTAITLDLGTQPQGAPTFDLAFWTCNTDTYYWVAWAWDPTGLYLTHSSAKGATVEVPIVTPQIELSAYTIIGDSPNDTLLIPGQTATLAITLTNIGTITARNLEVSFTPEGAGMPVLQTIDILGVNESVTFNVALSIPSNLSFSDTLVSQLSVLFNDCFTYQKEVPLIINALSICIYDIRLIDIRYLPPSILWDPAALPIFYPPDVYYNLFLPSEQLILRSITIEDADDDWPNTPTLADWPDITPCYNLQLDINYRIEFWDEDFDDDDYIGAVSFHPLDYITTRQEVIRITNDEVIADIYVRWE